MISKARMIKAERERAKRKADEEKKKEEEKAKKEKKEKKKKKKAAGSEGGGEEEQSSAKEDPPGKARCCTGVGWAGRGGVWQAESEVKPLTLRVSEQLLELVPGLVWAVVRPGPDLATPPENLVLPTRRPGGHEQQPSPSFIETMLILILIHFLFEYFR